MNWNRPTRIDSPALLAKDAHHALRLLKEPPTSNSKSWKSAGTEPVRNKRPGRETAATNISGFTQMFLIFLPEEIEEFLPSEWEDEEWYEARGRMAGQTIFAGYHFGVCIEALADDRVTMPTSTYLPHVVYRSDVNDGTDYIFTEQQLRLFIRDGEESNLPITSIIDVYASALLDPVISPHRSWLVCFGKNCTEH